MVCVRDIERNVTFTFFFLARKAMNLNSEAQQTDILEMEMYLLTVIEQYNRAKAAYNPLRQVTH